MQVAELNIYPVKSTRGFSVQRAGVQPWGLADDRRWMVVDVEGSLITARVQPALLGVRATPLGEGRLRLEGPHAAPLEVDATSREGLVPVRVWRSHLSATPAGPGADAWFGKLLDRDVRLVWLDDPTRRPTNPDYSRPGDRVSFADGYPILLTSAASLRQLNDWIVEEALTRGEEPAGPLPMRRFRPSVVVEHDEPFAEDHWRRLRIGGIEFRVPKPCDRCVLTTIDPDTLAKGKEPIRTLSRHRRWDGKVWFGTNLIPDGTGTISVGDPVEVLPD
ncbi:MAG TPA: MOSC N-terminal beta barrel domain-containing protein [Jiangellaceae bacterium]